MRKKNRCKTLLAGLVSMCMAFHLAPVQSMAAEREAYTYTVTFYAGNHGYFSGNANVSVSSGQDVQVSNQGSRLVVSGLSYNSRVSFNAPGSTGLENDKYYVRGIRRSGTDTSETQVGTPSFEVTGDQDYVVAYGISGDLVEYTVNYQDGNGNTLRESETYRGNAGDYMVVAYLYIEGYQPQAYNLGRTLTKNAAENVFTFVYTPVPEDENPEGGSTGGGGGTGGTTEEGGGASVPAPGTAEGAGAPAAGTAAGGAAADAGTGAAGGAGAAGADGEGAAVPDDEVPLDEGPEDLINLDDEEVPLAEPDGDAADAGETEGNTRNIAGAVAAAGISAAALIALFVLWLKKRKNDQEEAGTEEK